MQNIYLQPNRSACHDGFVERGCEKSQKHFVDRTFLHVKNVRLCAISAASSFCCCFRLRVDTHKAIPTVRLGGRRRQEERRFPRGTGRRLKISLLRSSSGLRWRSPARVERHITRNWRCRRAASCWQMHFESGPPCCSICARLQVHRRDLAQVHSKPFPFRSPEGRVALVIEVEKARYTKLTFEHTPPH